jgi:hypothetical protein
MDMDMQLSLSNEINQLSGGELDEVTGGAQDLMTVAIHIGEFVMFIAATPNSHDVWTSVPR